MASLPIKSIFILYLSWDVMGSSMMSFLLGRPCQSRVLLSLLAICWMQLRWCIDRRYFIETSSHRILCWSMYICCYLGKCEVMWFWLGSQQEIVTPRYFLRNPALSLTRAATGWEIRREGGSLGDRYFSIWVTFRCFSFWYKWAGGSREDSNKLDRIPNQ